MERKIGLYERYLLPRLIDYACGMKVIGQQRALLVPGAQGRVLEVGAGSGLNFPFYDRQRVEMLWALEPAGELRRMASAAAASADLPITMLDASAEAIPLDSNTVDTVVMTYTLCTIPDAARALDEMRRVLKPGGRLLFSEHGRAPDQVVRRWQDGLTPLWKRVAGGCHLNRDVATLLRSAGFEAENLKTEYLARPRAFAFNYRGSARAR